MGWFRSDDRYSDPFRARINVAGLREARIKRISAYAAVYLLWGGVYLAIRVLVDVLPPFLVAGFRYSLAALCFLPLSFLRRDPRPEKHQLGNGVWTGITMLAVGYGVVFWAEQRLAS